MDHGTFDESGEVASDVRVLVREEVGKKKDSFCFSNIDSEASGSEKDKIVQNWHQAVTI